MRLTKHHGLGNDFLVLVDLDATVPVTAEDAVALCHRHTGVGADGLLRASRARDGADVAMRLWNADGSIAEMSGNGIRCLVQAVLQAGIVTGPTVVVATDAGLRQVEVLDVVSPSAHRMSVEMGPAKIADPAVGWDGPDVRAVAGVDLGNPHVVIHWGGAELPALEQLVEIGSHIDGASPAGANVEIVRAGPDGAVEMVVYERGVGPTLACGTGACAAAAAAHLWGIGGGRAEVRMPGGSVEVVLGDPVLLVGDATSVAAVDVPWPAGAPEGGR